MGSQLVLEGRQRCLAHGSLRELVPQYNGPWEKNSVGTIYICICMCCLKSGLLLEIPIIINKKRLSYFKNSEIAIPCLHLSYLLHQ